MAEYIDREKLKYDIRNWIVDYEVNGEHETADCLRECIDLIDDTPTADVVEVVRCEKCNQFRRYTKVNQNFGVCRRSKMEVSWHDFCSYGEREED